MRRLGWSNKDSTHSPDEAKDCTQVMEVTFDERPMHLNFSHSTAEESHTPAWREFVSKVKNSSKSPSISAL